MVRKVALTADRLVDPELSTVAIRQNHQNDIARARIKRGIDEPHAIFGPGVTQQLGRHFIDVDSKGIVTTGDRRASQIIDDRVDVTGIHHSERCRLQIVVGQGASVSIRRRTASSLNPLQVFIKRNNDCGQEFRTRNFLFLDIDDCLLRTTDNFGQSLLRDSTPTTSHSYSLTTAHYIPLPLRRLTNVRTAGPYHNTLTGVYKYAWLLPDSL